MKKSEIIEKLQSKGETWANNSYSKEYLERYLKEYEAAQQMTAEQLLAIINGKKK